MAGLLDGPTLDRFSDALAAAGAPIADALQPGIDRAEQIDLASSLDLELSDEALTWWSWRNGAVADAASPNGDKVGFVSILSLELAVEQTKMMDGIAGSASWESEPLWRPNWLAMADADGASIACDCNPLPGGASPIRYVDFEFAEEGFDPVLPSIRALVEFWIEALERKYRVFDQASGLWQQGEPWVELSEDLQLLI